MAGWIRQICVKFHVTTQSEPEDKTEMISKFGILIFFITSACIAIFVSVLPNFGTLLGIRQLGWKEETPSSLSVKLVNSGRRHPLFCNPLSASTEGVNEVTLTNSGVVADATSDLSNKSSKKHKESETTGEALAAKNLAKEMVEQGKMDKALKLYEHAMALDPNHPDILNEYGEFMEKKRHDVVSAEHLYCRALTRSPSHTKALSNRQRTLPLVEEIDQSSFNRIDQKRDMLMNVPDNHPGLRRQIQEDYFRHIYHTTAIEGNTFTLSQTRSLVETRLAIAGKSIIEHNEILGMDAAMHFINSSLIQRLGAIKVKDILDLHHRVLGFVDPIGAGQFRTTQVFVGDFIPPSAKEVQYLVDEFVQWLNSEDALSLHPIELAALAHYKLVYIHPFYDGNGRTSRLLMNLVLMQAGFPPIIIKVEEKHEYYQHLQTANDGDVRPFIRFIARCTERSIDSYLLASIDNMDSKFPPSLRIKRDDGRTIILEDQSQIKYSHKIIVDDTSYEKSHQKP